MQDGLFFRVVRRFNIVWIAILGLVLIAACGHQLYKNVYLRHNIAAQWGSMASRVITTAPAGMTILPEPYGSRDTDYGPWDGKVFALSEAAPFPDPRRPETIERYFPARVVNVMVIDGPTGKGTWLFPTNKQIVASRDCLYEGEPKTNTTPATDPRPPIGMILIVNAVDKTGRADANAKVTVLHWAKGTASTVKLLTVDEVLSYDQSGADRYMVLYRKDKETRVATYSVPEFKLLSDTQMPDAPK